MLHTCMHQYTFTNMHNNRPTRRVKQSHFNVYVWCQIFYLPGCIIYHIIAFDCQEQFTPAVKCKLCGEVSRLLQPAVRFFFLELTLLVHFHRNCPFSVTPRATETVI